MKLQRVDEIVGTLTEGASYLVPVIWGSISGRWAMGRFPVIGPRHYDVEFFNVHMPHYHIDLRFFDMKVWRDKYQNNVAIGVGRAANCALPVPEYKEMKCLQANVMISNVRSTSEVPDGEKLMNDFFRGHKCGGSRGKGWICPHKGTYLGSTPVNSGVITCPAHGLRIEDKTGRVL